jgi:hypothetical protein
VETRVQALFASVHDTPLGKVRLCDIHKLAKSLKLREAYGLYGVPNECLRHLPKRPLVIHLTFIESMTLAVPFSEALEGRQVITLLKPGKDQKFLKIYVPSVSCLQQASYSRELF